MVVWQHNWFDSPPIGVIYQCSYIDANKLAYVDLWSVEWYIFPAVGAGGTNLSRCMREEVKSTRVENISRFDGDWSSEQ